MNVSVCLISVVYFIVMILSVQVIWCLLMSRMIPILSSTYQPIIRSYLDVGESKTSALMSTMLLFDNSGGFTCNSITDSLLLKVPLLVVVSFGVPLVVPTPKKSWFLYHGMGTPWVQQHYQWPLKVGVFYFIGCYINDWREIKLLASLPQAPVVVWSGSCKAL